MPEWILEPPEPPSVLVSDRALLCPTRFYRGAEHRLGVINDEQHAPCLSSHRLRAEPVQML